MSLLNEFLCQALIFTEEVKNVLKYDCNEAMYSLYPWRVETFVKKEIDENTCICSKKTPETAVEEIAAGISRALLQTQQLREKLSLNVVKQKKCSKQSNVFDIYRPKHVITGKRSAKNELKSTSTDNKQLLVEKGNIFTKLKTQAENPNKKLQNEINSCRKNGEKTRDYEKQSMKLTAKRIKPKEKNYLAINKSNVKIMKQIDCTKITNDRPTSNSKIATASKEDGSMNFSKRHSVASTSELKSLIQKVSIESNACAPPLETVKLSCPLHGDVSSQAVYEQNFVAMDVVDSLDRYSIPGEIVKTLKVYHTYLKSVLSNESIDTGKRQKTVDKFLIGLKETNKSMQDHLIQKADFISLLSSFISLFQNLFVPTVHLTFLDDLKRTSAKLNATWKRYEAKECDINQIRRPNAGKEKHNICGGWVSNGIWNHATIKNIEGITRTCSIRYASKEQLLSFFEAIQQLQETQYLNSLIDILLRHIIPNTRKSFDPSNPDCIRTYKMIRILCQGLNPKIPVLVRTDE